MVRMQLLMFFVTNLQGKKNWPNFSERQNGPEIKLLGNISIKINKVVQYSSPVFWDLDILD